MNNSLLTLAVVGGAVSGIALIGIPFFFMGRATSETREPTILRPRIIRQNSNNDENFSGPIVNITDHPNFARISPERYMPREAYLKNLGPFGEPGQLPYRVLGVRQVTRKNRKQKKS